MVHLTHTHTHTQVLAEGEGNVHSGATPPWLQEDSVSGEDHTPIGPPIEAFLKHSKHAYSLKTVLALKPRILLMLLHPSFILHLTSSPSEERLRQAGRNPKRVGADFHRNLTKEDNEDETWSVWL